MLTADPADPGLPRGGKEASEPDDESDAEAAVWNHRGYENRPRGRELRCR